MSEVNMTNLLNDLRVAASKASSGGGEGIAQPGVQSVDFGSVFKNALDAVNASQQTSDKLKDAFELGEPGIDLPQVMVATQKASVAFQGMLEVRKQLLKAYQDVMSMQV
jgi:flagellar hook-basal body complex protein FliE